jgi:hypothetical protein
MKRCPFCGADNPATARFCSRCGRQIAGESASSASPVRPASDPSAAGVVWLRWRDAWNGFELEYPSGWEVRCLKGIVTAQEDTSGNCIALLWPIRLPAQTPLIQVAQQLVGWGRSLNPTFTAWQVPEASSSRYLTLRTQSQNAGVTLVGSLTIHTDATGCGLISGFQCPASVISSRVALLGKILSSFEPTTPMAKQTFREPTEGAFTAQIPAGWLAQGMVNRQHINAAGTLQFTAMRDSRGLVQAAQTNLLWFFTEGMGMLELFGFGAQSRPYLPAPQFCMQFLAPQFQQTQTHFQVEGVQERPDWIPMMAAEIARVGMSPQSMELSAAVMTTSYEEQGTRLQQKTVVTVQRYHAGLGMGGHWSASLVSFYRAPVAEMAQVETILTGILDSVQANPAWEQNELQRARQYTLWAQQDMARRRADISRTLSETTEMIMQGYYERSAAHDRMSYAWSNAFRGRQDMTDSFGDVYNVPIGYDQYWRDNLGNIYGGTWLTNPDPSWHRLEPTGL